VAAAARKSTKDVASSATEEAELLHERVAKRKTEMVDLAARLRALEEERIRADAAKPKA
jgi:hypothetical protein